MKTFDIPIIYRSPLINAIKKKRKKEDRRKKDFSPTLLDFGPVQILLARHFGFCYGVENAIEIAFKTLEENPGKRVFLLSEMIHNPHVNNNLKERGIRFIMDTSGRQLIPWEAIGREDIVIIPAFGTTLEIEEQLGTIGVDSSKYNTTCPFVERVWNKAASIGEKVYTVIIHGKPRHEETRATFSHSNSHTPTLVIRDMDEAKLLGDIILGKLPEEKFYDYFQGQYSHGFDVHKDLIRVGVVNQTTMLANETQGISDHIRSVMTEKFQLTDETVLQHFADTRDTLCYATNDNQHAVTEMLKQPSDLALVVGGYNSSNTSHLVELCERNMPTYFISSEEKILSRETISHWDLTDKEEKITSPFLPAVARPVRIALTSGASCPDALVENVIRKLLAFYGLSGQIEEKILQYDTAG